MAVTVSGQNGPLTITTGPGDALNLASQLGFLLSTIQGAGSLSVTTNSQSGGISQPLTDAGGVFDTTGTAGDVSRLYQALLNRGASDDGLNFWTNQVDNLQVPLTAIAAAIAASPEFIQRYGSLSDAGFIDQLYHNVLGRAPDDSGRQFWEATLAAGGSRGDVALAIAGSSEAKGSAKAIAGDRSNGEIHRLYEAAFGRAPDDLGGAFWASLLSSGSTVEQVAEGIAATAEFQSTFGAMGDSGFVAAMYQNALQRTPSAEEVQGWVSDLQGGASRASVLVAFADSAESRALNTTSELQLSGSGGLNASVPGGYHYIVANDSTSDTLTASNAAIVTNTVGGAFFVSGLSTVAATGGNNTVNATGTYDLSFGPGNNLVIASGSGTIATGLGASTVVAANTSGPGNLIDLHGTDLVNAALGNNTINAAGSSDTIIGGVGNLTANFVGAATAATVFGGSGGSTIFGGANSNVTFNGSGDLAYSAAAGSVTLNAAAASGKVTATMGSGENTFIAGAGAETLTAGSGINHFSFIAGNTAGETDVINDTVANIANDTFSFTKYSTTPVDSTVTGGPLTLTLSDNTKLIFTNLTNINQLNPHITT